MRPGIAPEAWSVLGYVLLPGVVLISFLAFITETAAVGTGVVIIVFIAFCFYFFRDPVRITPQGDRLIVAPADGRIIDISRKKEEEFTGGECIRISIFMSLWNVHVNRIPVDGEIEYMKHHDGDFLAAFKEKASSGNEMQSVGIRTKDKHRILTRQIAGFIARRIRTYVKTGEVVRTGDKLGMIAFGSRVDIFLPLASRIAVSKGQNTRSGESILGELP